MNAMSYLLKGGPVMYVLLPMSAITLAVGIERLVVLGREKRQTEAVLDILSPSFVKNRRISEKTAFFPFEVGSSPGSLF